MKNNSDIFVASEKFKILSRHAIANLHLTTSLRILDKWSLTLNNNFIECKRNLKNLRKLQSDTEQNEYNLDTILFMQCSLGCLKSMFDVLIRIKREDNFNAWASLIDSYDYLKIAESYIDKYQSTKNETQPGIEFLLKKCKEWEVVMFPRNQAYTSPGFKETVGLCSICNSSFLNCEHIEGYIYFGKYCKRIERHIIEADHIALVEVPRDKRCIVTTRHDEENYVIDFFSRERIEGKNDPDPQYYQTVFLNINGVDL